MDGCEYAWPCVGMRMGKMAVLQHASLMPDYMTSVSNRIGLVPPISFPVLPHVFRKEYGLVSCKPLSWYTPKGEAVMMVPWPWIKASIRSGGMGVSGWDREGGTP